MLTNLHVKNLALIDEAEVEFGPGLNILTGETGAGKSILIGSINAALGKKISREMIRTGETSALVELVFETENPHVISLIPSPANTISGSVESAAMLSKTPFSYAVRLSAYIIRFSHNVLVLTIGFILPHACFLLYPCVSNGNSR